MEAQELRIGNYVNENYGGLYYVAGIYESGFVDLIKPNFKVSGRFNLKDIKPIPITNKMLLDFGFIKSKISEWYHLEDFQIEIVVDENNNFIFCVVNGFVIRHLKYIHQLQNLYFDLNQKELTFKTK